MPRLPRITARDALRAVQRDGWTIDHTRGSHTYLIHPTKLGTVCVAMHAGIIPPKTTQSIIRQAGLTVDAFITLL